MSHANRATKDSGKNPEYHVVVAIKRLRTDKNCPAEKSWPNYVKNEQHIGSKNIYISQNTEQSKNCRTAQIKPSQSSKINGPSLISCDATDVM